MPAAAAAVHKAVDLLSALGEGPAADCAAGSGAGEELLRLLYAVKNAENRLKSVSSLDINANTLQAGVLTYNVSLGRVGGLGAGLGMIGGGCVGCHAWALGHCSPPSKRTPAPPQPALPPAAMD